MPIKAEASSRTITLTVLLLTLAAAFVRMYGLGTWDYYHDEIWHVYIAQQASLADIFYTDLTIDGHPVLPYFLWHYLLILWDDPWMARLPSLIAGILCVPMGYLLGKEMFKTKGGGLFSAFFMAFSCLMIEQSDVVRGYALMTLFGMIAMWCVYRYRERPSLAYLLLYFITLALAFLCEFAVAPLAAFTALHLLYSIYRQPHGRRNAFGIWAFIHLVLFAYLLCFLHLSRTIGMLDFTQSHFFIKMRNQGALFNAASIIIYFVQFVYDAGFLAFPASVSTSEIFIISAYFPFLLLSIMGFAWLIRYRKWDLLAYVLLSIGTTVILFYLETMPIDRSRRSMGVVLSLVILFYGGYQYLLRDGLKNCTLRIPAVPITLAATALLCLSYAAYGKEWRMLRPTEFQQTRVQTEEIFQFLADHVNKDDLILTDWSSYFHFWKNVRACPAEPIASKVAYYSCYRAPVFVLRNDMRKDSFMMNMAETQQAFWQLDKLHYLKNVKNVWIVGLQHINVKTIVLNPTYASGLRTMFSVPQRERYAPEIKQLAREQESFARLAYAKASAYKVAYAMPCGRNEEDVGIGDEDNHCLISIALLALPMAIIDDQFIRHAPYHDPALLLKKAGEETRN